MKIRFPKSQGYGCFAFAFFARCGIFFRRLTLFYHLGLRVFGDLFEFSSEIRLFNFNGEIAIFQLQFGLSYIWSYIGVQSNHLPTPNHELGSINIIPELNWKQNARQNA